MKVIQDFSGGKMNMDIDPRYMPKGQYREARNVRVIDTDGENSGVIESVDGTRVVIDEPLFTAGSVTAGMYEYNNKIYLFTALKQGGFSILEYDSVTGKGSHILVDQLSTLREEDGLRNTICFLHNKKDDQSVFTQAYNQGFGWYVPSKEEIKDVIDNIEETWKFLISEREEDIITFNNQNIGVGTAVEVQEDTPTPRFARALSTPVPVSEEQGSSGNYYWTSTEYDKDQAYVYGFLGLQLAPKTSRYMCVVIKRFRFDIPPKKGDSHDGGTIYKVDMEKMEARAMKMLPTTFVYDSTPEVLTQDLVTPFNLQTRISGFAMLNDIMVFHDWMTNEPVEIDTSKTRGYFKFYDWTAMKLVKRPPLSVGVEIAEKSELGEMRNINPLFAARYVYDTRETSAISPYSTSTSELDDEDSKKVEYDMMVECYAYTNKVKIVNSYMDPVSGVKVYWTSKEMSMALPDSGTFTFYTKSFKTRAYDTTDTDFKVEGVLAFAGNRKDYVGQNGKGFFVHFNTSNDSVDIIGEGFNNKNDGADINKNGDQIYYARTHGASGSNNGQLMLFEYNKNDNSISEIQGFVGDGDQLEGGFCMSDSGKQVYVVYKSEFAYSSEYGKGGTFTQVKLNDFITIISKPRGVKIICDSDGSVVYISCNQNFDTENKYTLVSENYGKNFTTVSTSLVNEFMCCSSNGKFFALAGKTVDTIYYSKDSGKTMSKVTPQYVSDPQNYQVTGMSMSPDGRTFYVTAINGNTAYLFASQNYGLSITKINNYSHEGVVGASVSYVRGSYSNETLNEISNATSAVNVKVNTGNEHVEKIEILMKTGAGMYKVKTIDKKKLGLEDNVDYTYKFSYSGNYPLVPMKDVNKLFDNVPMMARSCMIIQNSLLFGGYVDGFDIDTDVSLEVKVNNTPTTSTTYSLKTGTTQGYGIIFMDDFGRCSPVLAPVDVTVPRINADAANIGRVATVTVKGKAPSWATKFKFARRNPKVLFDVIDGFDNAYVINGKFYLEITSMPWIVPTPGDKLELVSEMETIATEVSTKGYIFEVKDKVIVQGEPGKLSVTLSDGTKVDMGDPDKVDVPNGRYLIIEPSAKEGYTEDDILKKESRWTTSVFYLIMYETKDDTVVYQEIPGIHDVEAGLAGSYVLDSDGDVMITTGPAREINKFSNGTLFTTLGRPNAISDNYSREDRYASLTVSEPYVEDTKDNGLASFNQSLINYTDLSKKYGEIVKIDDIGSDIDVYQRNKCSRVMYKKNILNSATGSPIVAKSEDTFGEQQEYAEDYGMSHYETYSRYGNSRFFVDTNTGQVIRKSINGLFPVSSYGMLNYFHDKLTTSGVKCGAYDPKTSSYIVGMKDCCVNFMEPVDGWTSFYDMAPDLMARAGAYCFSTRDTIIRRMGGEPGYQNLLLGKTVTSKIHLVNNEYMDSNKVYNSIVMESNTPPSTTTFKTFDLERTIDQSYFKKKENLLESFIPKAEGTSQPVLLYVAAGDEETLDTFRTCTANLVDTGLDVFKDGEKVSRVKGINDDEITLEDPVDIKEGQVLYVKVDDGVNGDAIRGKYLEIISYFSVDKEKLLVKSIQLDIDESKI